MSAEETPPYKIFYHTACKQFYGRAIAIVLALDHAGVNYTIENPDKAPEEKGFAPPIVTLPSGQTVAQTLVILDVLGEALGLSGDTLEKKIACKQAMHDLNDIFSEVLQGKFKDKPERADKWFSLLEGKLADHKFMVSENPTVADFYGVFAFEWVSLKFGDIDADKFPKLAQWLSDVYEVAAVKKMKTSSVAMIPN